MEINVMQILVQVSFLILGKLNCVKHTHIYTFYIQVFGGMSQIIITTNLQSVKNFSKSLHLFAHLNITMTLLS